MAAQPGLIRNWHAHVYFDPPQRAEAAHLCEQARDALGVAMGRVHPGAVGPHPRGSCLLTIRRGQIGAALEWLLGHRGPFTVMVHANTGDDLADHTRNVIWLGPAEPLDLAVFAAAG